MEIKVEVKGVKEAMQRLKNSRFAVMKVGAMALNRAAKTGQVQTQKIAREEYTMKARDAKDKIEIKKANMRWLQAELIVTDKPIPLTQFQHKGIGGGAMKGAHVLTRRGERRVRSMFRPVSVMVKKSGGYKQLARGFKATGKYGVDIFVRTGKARGPLKALRGPSMAGIVKDTVRMELIKAVIKKRFVEEFDRGIQYAIDKGRIKEGGDE